MKILSEFETGFVEDPNNFVQIQPVEPGKSTGLLTDEGNVLPLNEKNKLPLTFTPFTLRGVTFNNRMIVSPMCTYSCQDGFLNDWHIAHYGSFSLHSPGGIIVEATGVQSNGRISIYCNGIWKDEHIAPHKKVVNVVKRHNVKIGIQLCHAGRKASSMAPWMEGGYVAGNNIGGWPDNVVGPSAIAFSDNTPVPRELSVEEIHELIEDFGKAAIRADKAGYDFIELHGAHGYLISEFLSPNSNRRTDEYGGSFENRIRFAVEVCKKVRSVLSDHKPLWVRLSCTEWVEDGWDINDTVKLATVLKEIGVDFIDCSSGGISSHQVVKPAKLYQVPFAEQVRNQAKIPTGAVGIITKSQEIESILQDGKADLILAARQFLREPSFTKRVAHEMRVEMKWVTQYERGRFNRL
ncbi:hypothetical protein BB558_006126 [Smittium angustum]|uniref:NADH:flavin oxidoreductase/NADH oxidase N-terminal domain-containing protein n=1 Tax=Smittium angustum TaxID=133377 RepID=A0A2U1IYK5_SMIAN|nr:hypothetical protein BB558_006126 [Smittium angustum]